LADRDETMAKFWIQPPYNQTSEFVIGISGRARPDLSICKIQASWIRRYLCRQLVETRIFSESDPSLGWLQFYELEKIAAMAPEIFPGA
jgi:hypothetical protein